VITADFLYVKEDYQAVLRISSSEFEFLLNNIGRTIGRQDTDYRESVAATERLALTLRFLATRDSYGSLSYVELLQFRFLMVFAFTQEIVTLNS
jgi:hypothetical protein